MRWVGGKRWLSPYVSDVADEWRPSSFYEPFLGGAAIFLGRDWPTATLGDVNSELIAMYRGIAQDPELVEYRLRSLPVDRHIFESLRGSVPDSDIDQAVRFLYLNRCAYGGLYRTNQAGVFNVPYSGDRSTLSLWADGRLGRLANAFASATLGCGDFEETLSGASSGALVYCDPPYTLPERDRHGGFRRYSPVPFSWNDQIRLAEVAHELAQRGALVIVSNSTDPRVQALYPNAHVRSFQRRAPLPKARGGQLAEAVYVLAPSAVDARLVRAVNCG